MSKAIRSAKARRDLREIARYIAIDTQSIKTAERVIDDIDERIALCVQFPELGVLCPDLGSTVRRTVVSPYCIFYEPTKQGIQVLRVIHSSRDIDRAWQD